MDEDDLGPWLRRKESQGSSLPAPSPLVFPPATPVHPTPDRHRLPRRTRDASHNAKLDYYRKSGSEAPVKPINAHIKSVWIPRAKLQSKSPDQHEPGHHSHNKGSTEKRVAGTAIRSSRSFIDLAEVLEMGKVQDREVIFHMTRDIGKVVNWSPKPPLVLPPLVKSYRRRTPLRWERAGRWLEDFRESHSQAPRSRIDLQPYLHSRQMSPRP